MLPTVAEDPPIPDIVQHGLDEAFFGAAAQARFRGEIWDYARTFELGSSYEVPADNVCKLCRSKGITACRHFEIDTARQIAGPMRAIADPNVRILALLKAVQTLGSLAYDLALHWLIVHSEYKTIIVFLDADDKALSYADKRLMPTLKANPDIVPLLPTGAQRFDDKKCDIKFTNGKILRVCGLNDTNASSLTWQVVVIDEGWLHHSDGLMQKAIDRSKQVQNRKVIIIGQAGNHDEDQDKIWRGLNRHVPITFACPCCGGRQEFSITSSRPADFVPRAPDVSRLPSQFQAELLPPAPGTYWGLKVKTRFADIKTEPEIKSVAATARFECYHCGFEIPDTRDMRRRMMATYEQDYQSSLTTPAGEVVKFTPENFEVGFWNPDPSSVTIPFAQTMQEYIIAKKTQDEIGTELKIQDFYKNRWATAWNPDLTRNLKASVHEHYDVKKEWLDEWRRGLIIDNQHELQTQWASAWAVSRSGKSRQLWRGPLKGLGTHGRDWKTQPDTVAGKQAELGIKDQWVFLDGAYMRQQLVDECAKHGHWGTVGGQRVWLCWNLLVGSKWTDFAHADEKNAKLRFNVSDPVEELRQVNKFLAKVLVFNFSALKCGDMAAAHRDGKAAETLFLPETDDVKNPLSWTAQINSHARQTAISKHSGMSQDIWLPRTQNTPDHYWHILRMFMAVKCIWQVDGVFEAPPDVTAQ